MTDTRKAIFITGGASGIGRATALYFGARGWFVGLGDVNEAKMAETQDLLANGFNYAHRLDVRERAQWDEALEAFSTAAGGRIDVVFNNAGVGVGGDIAELDIDEMNLCLDVNLRGVLYGAAASYAHLKKTAPGSALINTASAAGIAGASGMSVYCATKFGVRGIAESLDAEWAGDGIKVASICPSFIETPLLDGTGNRQSNETVRARVLEAGLEISPVEDVAECVWRAAHGRRLHYLVGKTARRMHFVKRWMPGKMRKNARNNVRALGR